MYEILKEQILQRIKLSMHKKILLECALKVTSVVFGNGIDNMSWKSIWRNFCFTLH